MIGQVYDKHHWPIRCDVTPNYSYPVKDIGFSVNMSVSPDELECQQH